MSCAVLIVTKQVEGTNHFGTSSVVHVFANNAAVDAAIIAAEQQIKVINTSVNWKRTSVEFIKMYDVATQIKIDAMKDAHMNLSMAKFKDDQIPPCG